jgi:hypothetical protein
MKKLATLIAMLAVLTAFASTALAQDPVQYSVTVEGTVVKGSPSDHFHTFNGPVHVPDVVLPAGTYIFTMLGSSVVQVLSADRSQQLAMFFTAPVQRLEAGDNYEVRLVTTGNDSPRRISKWFLPNQSLGFEFLYPTSDVVRGER